MIPLQHCRALLLFAQKWAQVYLKAKSQYLHPMLKTELVIVDATGLACPLPLLKAKQALNKMATGQQLRVIATDQGSVRDFQVFAEQSGHILLQSQQFHGKFEYLLQKK